MRWDQGARSVGGWGWAAAGFWRGRGRRPGDEDVAPGGAPLRTPLTGRRRGTGVVARGRRGGCRTRRPRTPRRTGPSSPARPRTAPPAGPRSAGRPRGNRPLLPPPAPVPRGRRAREAGGGGAARVRGAPGAPAPPLRLFLGVGRHQPRPPVGPALVELRLQALQRRGLLLDHPVDRH